VGSKGLVFADDSPRRSFPRFTKDEVELRRNYYSPWNRRSRGEREINEIALTRRVAQSTRSEGEEKERRTIPSYSDRKSNNRRLLYPRFVDTWRPRHAPEARPHNEDT